RLTPLVRAMFLVSNPIPVKFALNELGMRVGPPRLPLTEPDESTAAAIRTELSRHRIDLPVAV
ncbi:MAG TPA: dihydrodipicolinate synthase family protein, partial [Dehalococcoidia bacterium]|nr:dihydrodipicolinate synthase family protein [Dehalococcoidia bacterium]